MMRVGVERSHINFVGRARLWLIVSTLVLVIAASALIWRGFNLGLEFKGGTALRAEVPGVVSVEKIKSAFQQRLNLREVLVQREGAKGVLVQTEHLGAELQPVATQTLSDATGVKRTEIAVTDVGPKWGRQISTKALRALIVFLLLVVIYIAIRFDPKMAICALIALFHDLLATAGIYALAGFVVTPSTVIAILTILGYSLYDTIVIFDRVKERTNSLSAAGRLTYSDVANESLNQVFIRSINTSITGILPVLSLLVIGVFLLGAETLQELALALLIGIGVGTYSSIFVATPLLANWKEREPRWLALRQRIAARGEAAARFAAKAESQASDNGEAPGAEAPDKSVAAAPQGARRPAGQRPVQRRKKKKKRR